MSFVVFHLYQFDRMFSITGFSVALFYRISFAMAISLGVKRSRWGVSINSRKLIHKGG